MAILDLQRRDAEAGRIRFGNKKGNRPNRLDHPLLTSSNPDLLIAVAEAYGSKVEPWPNDPENQGQVEVHGELRILVPVSPEPFSQFWERWSGGGCMRRCDGFHDQIQDAPCDCDKKSDKRDCSATTRIAVLLPETGESRWRIETKSLHAAIGLPAALEAAVGEKSGEVIAGVLRVEQRRGKKGTVPVPTITLSKSGAASPALEAGGAPVDRVEPEAPVGPAEASGSPVISEAQRRRMFAVAKQSGVVTGDLKEIILGITGQDSSKAIPREQYDEVIAAIEKHAAPADALFPEPSDHGDPA